MVGEATVIFSAEREAENHVLFNVVDGEYFAESDVERDAVRVWRSQKWNYKPFSPSNTRKNTSDVRVCVSWREQSWPEWVPEDDFVDEGTRDHGGEDGKTQSRANKRVRIPGRPRSRELPTIVDEEQYWSVVNGISSKGRGRPTIPRGEVLSARMAQYHLNNVAAYEKERNKHVFEAWFARVKVDATKAIVKEVVPKWVRKKAYRAFMSGAYKPIIGQMRLELNLCGRRLRVAEVRPDIDQGRALGKAVGDGLRDSFAEGLRELRDAFPGMVMPGDVREAVNWVSGLLKRGMVLYTVLTSSVPIEQRLLSAYCLLNPEGNINLDAVAVAIAAIVRVYKNRDEIVGQSTASIAAALKALCGVSLDRDQETIMRQYIMGTKVLGGVADTIKTVLQFVKPWLRKMWLDATGNDLFPDEVSDIIGQIQHWSSYVSAVDLLLSTPADVVMNSSSPVVVQACKEYGLSHNHFLIARDFMLRHKEEFSRLEEITRPLLRDRNSIVASMMAGLNAKMHRVAQRAYAVGNNAIERFSPLAVLLTGRTGQGKTFSSNILVKLVLKLLGFNYEGAELAYSRNESQEFWDGYVGQPVTQIEEFGAMDDQDQFAKACTSFLQMVGHNTYHVPMAALEDKNMTFRSVLILATTNMFGADNLDDPSEYSVPSVRFAKLTSPAAVLRRFKYMVRVVQRSHIGTNLPSVSDRVDALKAAWTYAPYVFVENTARGQIGKWERLKNDGVPVTWDVLQFAQVLANDILESARAPVNLCANQDVIDAMIRQCDGPIAGQGLWNVISTVYKTWFKARVTGLTIHTFDVLDKRNMARVLSQSFVAHMRAAGITDQADIARAFDSRVAHSFNRASVRGIDGAEDHVVVFVLGPESARLGVNGLMPEGWTPREDDYPLFAFNLRPFDEPMKSAIFDTLFWEVKTLAHASLLRDNVRAFWSTNLGKATVLGVGATALWAISWLLRRKSSKIDEVVGQLYPTENKQVVRASAGPSSKGRTFVIKGQAGYTDQMLKPEDIFRVTVDRGDGVRVSAHGMFVVGRVFITNYHTFCHLFDSNFSLVEDKTVLTRTTITLDNGCHTYVFRMSDLTGPVWASEGADLIVFNLDQCVPLKIPMARNRVKWFVKAEDIRNYLPGRDHLICMYRGDTNEYRTATGMLTEWYNFGQMPVRKYRGGDFDLSPAMAKVVNVPGVAGMCGAPYMCTGKSMARRYVGLHVAGPTDASCGYVGIVTEELLREALAGVGYDDIEGHSLVANAGQQHVIEALEAGGRAYDIEVGRGPGSPNTSAISETFLNDRLRGAFPMDERFRSTKGPALLKKKDGLWPMAIALSKMTVRSCDATQDEVQTCVSDIIDMFVPQAALGDHPRVFTLKQVFTPGGTGHQYVPTVDMDTSVGHALNMVTVKNRLPGKKSFFQMKDGWWQPDAVNGDLFLNEMRRFIREAHVDGRFNHVWDDCLKDEKRPLAKVESGESRLFNIGEGPLQVLIKMLTGFFAGTVIGSWETSPVKLGLPVHSTSWADFHATLVRGDETGQIRLFAGDYSGWDKNIDAVFIRGFFSLMRLWHERYAYPTVEFRDSLEAWNGDWGVEGDLLDFHRKFIDSMERDVLESRHCAFGVYYTVRNIIPSGHALTSVMNSICNMLVFDCAYRRTQGKSIFRECVVAVVGDDNVCSIRNSRSTFSCEVMAQQCARMGFVYTDFSKEASLRPYHSIDEIEFVKRKFKFVGGRIRAPLNWNSLTEMLMWKHGRVDDVMAVSETLRTFAVELVEYGKPTYEEIRSVVRREIARQGVEFPNFEDVFPPFGDFSADRTGAVAELI